MTDKRQELWDCKVECNYWQKFFKMFLFFLSLICRTPFGREYELAVWTYLNSHKAEEPQNHWMIVMSVPGSTVRPVPDQGKLHETVS